MGPLIFGLIIFYKAHLNINYYGPILVIELFYNIGLDRKLKKRKETLTLRRGQLDHVATS